MAYTGGPLNELNGKMGISAPYKSVPVMKLIRFHNPKSKEELVELIEWHSQNNCECGTKSQGSVESFGRNLFDSQLIYWGEKRFTLQECIQWEYDLFVVQSLKGGIIEKKAIQILNDSLSKYKFEEAEGYLDEELRIDIIIKKNGLEIGGIQVKPRTFKLMRREVITFNTTANQKWGRPVFYLYYDENEVFLNILELEKEIETY
ncbi:hypothetical protein ACFFGT_07620 [Mucilaginibacter angelicae]|uniref:Uncharacterized protein n=1 Tax=Mucilaginibacter angelicae TaxID=869718 RepID=A0ABV6L3L7_9SPHI